MGSYVVSGRHDWCDRRGVLCSRMAQHAPHATSGLVMFGLSRARQLIGSNFGHRLLALLGKEFRQIRRDRRLQISLIVPPTLQLLLFGFALDATVSNLRLGIVDDSKSPESRELIALMSESRSFRAAG